MKASFSLKSGGTRIIALIVVLAVLALLAALMPTRGRTSLLGLLPPLPEDTPMIVVEAEEGEFPYSPMTLFAGSFGEYGGGPLITALPLFKSRAGALVASSRENSVTFMGVLAIDRKEEKALAAGKLPASWLEYLDRPKAIQDARGPLAIVAANLQSPIYVEAKDRHAWLSDNLSDMDAMRGARTRPARGMKPIWSVAPRYRGHILVSDGGMIMASDGNPGEPLRLEAAWKAGLHRAEWKISGLRRGSYKVPSAFNWAANMPVVPGNLLLSAGVNLPSPGKNRAKYPLWAKQLAGPLSKFGLRDSEIAQALTGPVTVSLGGRTQILWYELPGVVLDVPGRGRLANRAIDLFWQRTFMGIEPRPIEGFTRGGSTDLPFSVIAAANNERMIFALADRPGGHNPEIENLLKRTKHAIGWLYADLPQIGASLTEMASVNTLLFSEDEENASDNATLAVLSDALAGMRRVFMVWKTPGGGSIEWFE